MRIRIENLPIRIKRLGENEMRNIFGGFVPIRPTGFKVSLEPGCALCLDGIARPEGGGEWLAAGYSAGFTGQ